MTKEGQASGRSAAPLVTRRARPLAGLLGSTALALLGSGGSAWADGDLAVTLAPGTTADSVVFEVRNRGSEAITLLTTNTPLEPLLGDEVFDIRRAAKKGPMFERPDWVGPHVRRLPPGIEDFVELAPGESRSAEVDLSELYDVSRAADFTISYSGELLTAPRMPAAAAFRRQSDDALAAVEPGSNTMVVHLEPIPATRTRPPAYNACSSAEQGVLVEATGVAEDIARESLDSLRAVPADQRAAARRYTEWFGTYGAERYTTVTEGFSVMLDSLSNATMSYDCTCDRAGVFAYVYPISLHEIYLCPVFWESPLLGTDSRAGTLVHELSHFTALVGTDDHAYGQAAARALADSSPDRAVDNADNFGYFAENVPALPMSGGDGEPPAPEPTPTPPPPTTTAATTLEPGVALSRDIAQEQIQTYEVRGADRVTVTASNGDPDLYVYSTQARAGNSLVCSSRASSNVDSCPLDASETSYLSVLGYSAASYEIIATREQQPEPEPGPDTPDPIVLSYGTPVSASLAQGNALLFSVRAPVLIELTSNSGDADLEVYSSLALTTSERICDSDNTTPIDLCDIQSTGTVYVVVYGYSAADFTLLTSARNSPTPEPVPQPTPQPQPGPQPQPQPQPQPTPQPQPQPTPQPVPQPQPTPTPQPQPTPADDGDPPGGSGDDDDDDDGLFAGAADWTWILVGALAAGLRRRRSPPRRRRS